MTYNLQAVAAMDDPEHATGKTLQQHGRPLKNILADWFLDKGFDGDGEEFAEEVLKAIKQRGYSILQRV